MQRDASRFLHDPAVQDGSTHPASVVDVDSDHFDPGNAASSAVNDVEVVRDPVQGQAFHRVQSSANQRLWLRLPVQAQPLQLVSRKYLNTVIQTNEFLHNSIYF